MIFDQEEWRWAEYSAYIYSLYKVVKWLIYSIISKMWFRKVYLDFLSFMRKI